MHTWTREIRATNTARMGAVVISTKLCRHLAAESLLAHLSACTHLYSSRSCWQLSCSSSQRCFEGPCGALWLSRFAQFQFSSLRKLGPPARGTMELLRVGLSKRQLLLQRSLFPLHSHLSNVRHADPCMDFAPRGACQALYSLHGGSQLVLETKGQTTPRRRCFAPANRKEKAHRRRLPICHRRTKS